MNRNRELRFADVNPDREALAFHDAPPRHRVSRPYASPGSRPFQLSGIVDDTIEKAPRLTYGLVTWRQAGYLLVRSICSRSRRHKEIRRMFFKRFLLLS